MTTLHLSYKCAARAFPAAGARPLACIRGMFPPDSSVSYFWENEGQGDLWVGREVLYMERMSWSLPLALGGSCVGRQMNLLFGNIPSSLHIFPRGWHWNQWHKAPPSGGNWQLAPPQFPLKYPHHEELGTTQQLQVLGPCNSSPELSVHLSSSKQAIPIQRADLLKTGGSKFPGRWK